MSISLPKPNIEPAPDEVLDEKRLREALKDIQRALEVVRQLTPLGSQDLANDAVGAAQIAAGAVGSSELATGAKELFLQLATAASRKVVWGNTTITKTESQTANKEIEHGLGTTPSVVVACTSSRDINVATFTYTSTKFTAEIRDITGANITANQEVHWIAIG